jgi:hypothetical protein
MRSGTHFGATAKETGMNGKLRMVVLACVAGCACAAVGRQSRKPPIELLDANGVNTPALAVESGGALMFVNGDARPHQIYSPDCPELASTALDPGQVYTAWLSVGPKVCHFQDLLAPLAANYSGTVHVEKPEHNMADDFTGTF